MNLLEPVDITCPYCGEPISLLVDCSAGSQEYIEDCSVCCRPIRLLISIGPDGNPEVIPHTDND